MTKHSWAQVLVLWVYGAIIVTAACGAIYLAEQQNYRQNANDPQIQLAEDGAAKLSSGNVPASLVDRNSPLTNIQTSLAPWVAVYDANGMPLEASAAFDNAPPKLPLGVFAVHAKALVDDPVWKNGEYRFTWQPEAGVRQAVVLVQTADGKYFVASGRSLRVVEERVGQLGISMLVGWIFTLSFLLVASFVGSWLLGRKK